MDLVGNVPDMSRKCPRHVQGTGTCPKIPETKSDGWPYFLQNLFSHVSIPCPQSKSRVQYSKKTKKKRTQINQIFQICVWRINLIPLQTFDFQNSSFGITKPILIPKWKNRCVNKRYASWTQKITAPPSPWRQHQQCTPPCGVVQHWWGQYNGQ